MYNGNVQQNPLCVESCVTNTGFYGDKILYKILNFSTRFSCQHFAVEDFVTLFMGINPFGTIGLTTANFLLLHSPVLLALFYVGQPP